MEDSLWISNCRCEEEGAIKSGGASWKRRGLEMLSESYLMCPWAITPSPNPLCSLRSSLDTLWLWLLWDVTVPEQRDSEIFPPEGHHPTAFFPGFLTQCTSPAEPLCGTLESSPSCHPASLPSLLLGSLFSLHIFLEQAFGAFWHLCQQGRGHRYFHLILDHFTCSLWWWCFGGKFHEWLENVKI